LDVGENALRRWVKQLSEERGGITPKSKALTPEQQRIKNWNPVVSAWSGRVLITHAPILGDGYSPTTEIGHGGLNSTFEAF
jgi:hypothetical protein